MNHDGAMPATTALLRVASLLGARMSGRQLAVLVYLAEESRALHLREVAAHLGIQKPAALRSIRSLRRAGFAARAKLGRDLRDAPVEITPAGQDMVAELVRSIGYPDAGRAQGAA